MNFTIPTPNNTSSNKQTLWTLVATGSIVLTGLVAGTLIKYRDQLRDKFREIRPTISHNHTSDAPLDEMTKADLYEQAREEDIPGRSSMTKAELVEALRTE